MKNKFLKMQGIGNDFVVFDSTHSEINFSPETIQKISDRKLGVGCDQVLFIDRPKTENTDFHYRIFNADGSEAEQCGNGARCIALFIQHQNLSKKTKLNIGTKNGTITTEIISKNEISVNMGLPNFEPSKIPFITNEVSETYKVKIKKDSFHYSVVSIGNPHAVLIVNDLSKIEINDLGEKIGNLDNFPEGVNVSFMEIKTPSLVSLRVYERGVGQTMACGSGACASAVIGISKGLLNNQVQVCQPGGNLMVSWKGMNTSILMTGPAKVVYEGIFEI
tara:strand:+ start:2532 stop:3362 length:831 start_codon:yes stop_codon:yes gene_type:complete